MAAAKYSHPKKALMVKGFVTESNLRTKMKMLVLWCCVVNCKLQTVLYAKRIG